MPFSEVTDIANRVSWLAEILPLSVRNYFDGTVNHFDSGLYVDGRVKNRSPHRVAAAASLPACSALTGK